MDEETPRPRASRIRRIALVATPALGLATLALGLRFGAGDAVRAAVVYGAPPPRAGGALAWQLFTIDEDHALRTAVPLDKLLVTARAGGRDATWQGSTNEDGVAELRFEFPGIKAGDPVELMVRREGEREPLAEGTARWPPIATETAQNAAPTWAGSGRKDGEIALEVAVYAGRLVPGFSSPVWVRAKDRATGAPLAGVTITVDPETSAQTSTKSEKTDERGLATFGVQPIGHVVALVLRAEGPEKKTGLWTGAPSVAPGAAHVTMPRLVPPDTSPHFDVVVPTVRRSVYVEIDDGVGRVFGTALALLPDAAGNRAAFDAPKLAAGRYWLITSADPQGSLTMSGATVARPFFVAGSDEEALKLGPKDDACALPRDPRLAAIEPCLALVGRGASERWVAIEGFAPKRAHLQARRAIGMRIALGAVLVAAVLEVLLIMEGVLAARRRFREARTGGLEQTAPRFGAIRVVAFILLAMLLFGFIAALVMRTA